MEKKSYGASALARAVEKAYTRGQTDYSMEPLSLLSADKRPCGKICPGDSVVFCCRRGEREIELTDMFTDPEFSAVPRRFLPGLYFVPLTLYHDKFKCMPVAFAPAHVEIPLAQVIAQNGKTQLHIAESEKYAHVTFFFNGGENAPFPGEEDICIPSPKGVPFDQVPELSLSEVADRLIDTLGAYDFSVVNFANGDVIGHTANNAAKLAAASCVSRNLGRVTRAAFEKGLSVLITADHGNLECMTTKEGKPHVAHTANLVPFLAFSPDGRPMPVHGGSLKDMAPTVLSLMGIEKPACMAGTSLIDGSSFTPGQKVLLVILDGWGDGKKDETNPIFLADTKEWDALVRRCPPAFLHASGEEVGLEAEKAGNSEAGHLNLGAGRVVMQDDQRLDAALRDGSFMSNPVFSAAVERVLKENRSLHLISYLTEKSSHGSIEYPLKLCELARGLPVFLHIIFDGRSTEPGSAPQMLNQLEERLKEIGTGRVVDGIGRGYALDRDGNFDKVRRAYDLMVEGDGTPYTE